MEVESSVKEEMVFIELIRKKAILETHNGSFTEMN